MNQEKFHLTVTWNVSINKVKQYMFHTHLLANMPTKENKALQLMRTYIKYY